MLLGGLLALPARGEAKEPWLLDAELSVGAPLNTPQRDWFGFGGSLALGVQKPLASWIALSLRLRSGGFLDGDTPDVAGVKDPGMASINLGTLGVSLRLPDGTVRRGTGLFLEGNAGGGFTGKELRPAFDVGLGYGFAVGTGFAIAPVVRYLQVIQPNKELDPYDARIGLLGVRLTMLDARPTKSVPEVIEGPRDRDGDGIPDVRDECIDVPEDKDGYQDEDGCPDPDNDLDGILDVNDGCPNMPEDMDGFQDEDGCPDEDNDQDGILDVDDQCPLEPETINGEQDQDGCPDQGLIVMHDDRIVLEERVLFDVLRARVKSSAMPVLEAIVRLWRQHPEWTKVRIEGHADVRGDAQFNQELSERRAANVRAALVKLGMSPDIIVAEGFGASRLLTTGTDEEDHRKNRRVEFVVIARYGDDGTVEPPPAEPEAAKPAPQQDTTVLIDPDEDPEAGATGTAGEAKK